MNKVGNFPKYERSEVHKKKKPHVPLRNQHTGWYKDVIMARPIPDEICSEERWAAIFGHGSRLNIKEQE